MKVLAFYFVKMKRAGGIQYGKHVTRPTFQEPRNVLAEIRRCAMAASVSSFLSFLFAAVGIIGDALNTTLVLPSTIWLLLAIFAGLHAVVPTIHLVGAKHFLGIEGESKKE